MDLIERDSALRQLHELGDNVRQGRGCIVTVTGEAGIGKTSLLTLFATQRPDLRVLWGGCEAMFSPQPLGPLYDIAAGLGSELLQLLSRTERRVELFAALLAAVVDGPRPTMVIIEDLHWADAATLDLARYLGRRVRRGPVLLVLSYRDDELPHNHPLRLVLGELPPDDVKRVPLALLSEQAVCELARRHQRCVDGLYAATGGNPFFVAEALRSDGLPSGVRDAVLARKLRQLPSVQEALDLVAIVPSRVECSAILGLLQPTADEFTAVISCGLLRSDGEWLAFRHELARLAVEESIPRPRAAELHARMLDWLETRARSGWGATASRLLHHALGAGDKAAVLRHAVTAALEADRVGAYREAVELYKCASNHANALPMRDRAEILDKYAYSCYMTNKIDNALAVQEGALAAWRSVGDRLREGRSLRRMSRLEWSRGRNPEAQAYADAAVALLEREPESAELAWAFSSQSQLQMLTGNVEAALAWGNRAIQLAERLQAQEPLAHALNNVGAVLYGTGDLCGRRTLERSLQIAIEGGFDEHVARAYVNLISQAVAIRDYASARRDAVTANAYLSHRDLDAWHAYVVALQARIDFEQGQWDAAETRATQAAVMCPGSTPITRIPALVVLARLALRRGRPGAITLLEEAESLAQRTGELQRLAPVAVAMAEAIWLGQLSTQRIELVREVYALARERADQRAVGELGFWLERLGGDLAPSDGVDPVYAIQIVGDWQAAAGAWGDLGCTYEQALTLLAGDHAARCQSFRLLEALGATRVLQVARHQLICSGVRGVPRGRRSSTAMNPAQLTRRELQILELLAHGMSNAEIARRLVRSQRTVDHHVSAVLRKLDVRSRGEAAAAARHLLDGQATGD